MLAQIVDEAVVQDGYMNALTDGFGENGASTERRGPMSDDTFILLSVILAVVVVAVLAVALIRVRRGLTADLRGPGDARRPRSRTSSPSTCARSSPRSRRSTPSSTIILGALPGIARKAAIVAERRPR